MPVLRIFEYNRIFDNSDIIDTSSYSSTKITQRQAKILPLACVIWHGKTYWNLNSVQATWSRPIFRTDFMNERQSHLREPARFSLGRKWRRWHFPQLPRIHTTLYTTHALHSHLVPPPPICFYFMNDIRRTAPARLMTFIFIKRPTRTTEMRMATIQEDALHLLTLTPRRGTDYIPSYQRKLVEIAVLRDRCVAIYRQVTVKYTLSDWNNLNFYPDNILLFALNIQDGCFYILHKYIC